MKQLKCYILFITTLTSLNLRAQIDGDADAFLLAAGVNKVTQRTAVNQLVLDMKAAGLWTKMKVIYPFVGGTANSHRYNLKDPTAYIIDWGGAVVHDANGITGDGTSAYGDTHFTLNNLYYRNPGNPNMDDMGWGWTIYNRSNNSQAGTDLGNADYDAGYIYESIAQTFTAKTSNCTAIIANPADPKGLYVWINHYTDQVTQYKNVYRNGILLTTGIVGSNGSEVTWNNNPNVSVGVLALHVGWSNEFASFSPNNLSFAAMHKDLTDAERTMWEAAVNKFECALSRANEGCTTTTPSTTSSSQWTTSGNNIHNSNTGNVGIGTANPGTFKLAVEGKLGARKIVVTQSSPWPDYVFDKEYKLPSLDELEKYTKINKHLPGIPSAQQVMKNGIDLGSNQALLLKKIEEMTLLMIKQEKRIKKLETHLKTKN